MQNVGQKKGWTLTPDGFRKLLDWLGEGTDSGGQSYLDMRRRLVTYFDRKNCHAPDELADETLNRVTRRLEEEGAITGDTPAHYCYIVARYVLLEYWRGERRNEVTLDTALEQSASESFSVSEWEATENREKLMSCLDRCAEKLEPLNRDLILRYYSGERRAKIENHGSNGNSAVSGRASRRATIYRMFILRRSAARSGKPKPSSRFSPK